MLGSVSLSDRPPAPGHGQHAAAGSAAATGETMIMSGSGSVVLPAGIINPSVPIRNIRTKFAVLIGLIQVGEVSNRDIVETVLNLVSNLKHLLIFQCFEDVSVVSAVTGQHVIDISTKEYKQTISRVHARCD